MVNPSTDWSIKGDLNRDEWKNQQIIDVERALAIQILAKRKGIDRFDEENRAIRPSIDHIRIEFLEHH